MKKTILPSLVVLLVLAGAAGAWAVLRKPPVTRDMVFFGNVDVRQVALAFNGTGRIEALTAQEGDQVQAGQVLGSLDTRTLALQIAQANAQWGASQMVLLRLHNGTRPEEIAEARANVVSAQADADNAGRHLARMTSANGSTGDRAVSQQDVESAQALARVTQARLDNVGKALDLAVAGPRKEEIAEAQAQADAAHAQVDLLNHYLEECRLLAPIAAVVRSRLLEPGDMADPIHPALALAVLSPKWVRAYVAETDLGRIRLGATASVTTDSHPDQPIAGRVGYLSSVAEFTPKTVQTQELRTSLVYEIRVLVEDPGDRLRLGMPATVRLAAETRAGTP
jgi:HlyD family secretion protein